MYKNKLCPLCPTLLQKLFPFSNKHYSQHAFDQYSIVHLSTGILLSLFFKKLSIVFIISRIFEFFENRLVSSPEVQKEFEKINWMWKCTPIK